VLGYTRLPVDGSYWPDLLPLYLTFALGMAFGFIPVTVAAFIGVAPQQAGLASGLLNTSQQIGGAIGVAVTATIFTSRMTSLIGDGQSPLAAATSGFHWGFAALVVFAALGALAALFLPRGAPRPAEELEEAAVPA
jgi:MFS family permease